MQTEVVTMESTIITMNDIYRAVILKYEFVPYYFLD